MDRVDFYETHIFKYSKRAGTKAAVMEHQIPEQVKTIRSNELLALDKEKRTKFEAQFLGKTVEVLMEESVEMNGKTYQVGHTKEYMKILLVKLSLNFIFKVLLYLILLNTQYSNIAIV